jgi:hypothetical protein
MNYQANEGWAVFVSLALAGIVFALMRRFAPARPASLCATFSVLVGQSIWLLLQTEARGESVPKAILAYLALNLLLGLWLLTRQNLVAGLLVLLMQCFWFVVFSFFVRELYLGRSVALVSDNWSTALRLLPILAFALTIAGTLGYWIFRGRKRMEAPLSDIFG